MPDSTLLTPEQVKKVCHELCEGVSGARPDHPRLKTDVLNAAFMAKRSPTFRSAVVSAVYSASQLTADEAAVDELLREFQRACEMVVVRGDSCLSETTKHRAILRNQLRAALSMAKEARHG